MKYSHVRGCSTASAQNSIDPVLARNRTLISLHCPNALVLERHLPALLALQDTLQADLDRHDAEQWARRHGQTWQIITTGILPRFSAAQRAAAAQRKPTLPLALLDGPQETP